MALAVLAAGGLYLLIPEQFRASDASRIAYPLLLVLLLVILIVGDPGRIDRESRWLRVTTGLMIGVITAMTGLAAVRLVAAILQQATFSSPAELLLVGAVVWTTDVIAFALWFWHLDGGGPAARAGVPSARHGASAFRFPEDDIPQRVAAGWYPQFIDYLALSFNAGTTFGPTDVSAVRHWSKLWLIVEAAVSLALVGLVVARAVNIL